MADGSSNRFSSLLLEGLDHYRRGRMLDAVRSWEEAYLLEPTNLRAREFLRSALERIHARMGASGASAQPGVAFQEMQQFVPHVPLDRLSGPGVAFRSAERHPWLRPPNETAPGVLPGEPAPPLAHEGDAHAELDDLPAVWESQSERSPAPAIPSAPSAPRGAIPPFPPVSGASSPFFPGGAQQPPSPPLSAPAPQSPAPSAPAARAAIPPLPPRPELRQPRSSPWDDGPSIALPISDPPPTERPGADWKINGIAPHTDHTTPDATGGWMIAAEELMALDDFSGALELATKVLGRHPEHARALAIRNTCEHNLLQMYESRLGGAGRRPRVVLSPDEVIWLNLDPRAGFVLAQIDGSVTFEDLYAICGLTHLDTARILSQLLDEGVIETAGSKPGSRPGVPRTS